MILQGCYTPMPAHYEDPLSGLALNNQGNTINPYRNISLGILVSKNAKTSMDVLRDYYELAVKRGGVLNQNFIDDSDPTFLVNGINSILKNRFKDVVQLDSLENVGDNIVDLVMVLDFRVIRGNRSGDREDVHVGGYFLTPQGKKLASVEGNASGVIPFPAQPQIKKLTQKALDQFVINLYQSTPLAEAAINFEHRLTTPAIKSPKSSYQTTTSVQETNRFPHSSVQQGIVKVGR